MNAVDREKYDSMTDFELVDELSRLARVEVPGAIEEIKTAEIMHNTVCEPEEMERVVKDILKIK